MASTLVETCEKLGEELAPILKSEFERSKAAGMTDERGNPIIPQEFYVRGVLATIEIGIRRGLLKG